MVKTRLLITALLLAGLIANAQYSQQQLNDLLMAARVAYAAATSAPPSYFYATNGQNVAGLYVRNYGTAGDGYVEQGTVSARGTATTLYVGPGGPGFDAIGYTGVTVRFSGTWMNGATQYTILKQSRRAGSSPSCTAFFRGASTDTNHIFMWADRDYQSLHVLTRTDPIVYAYKVHRVLVDEAWYALSYYWQAGVTHTSTVDGAYAAVYGYDANGFPSTPLSNTLDSFSLYVVNAWCGDAFATTNTVTYSDITNWNYQTAEATYNSNWPSLFTGDVEVTWREWSTNAP